MAWGTITAGKCEGGGGGGSVLLDRPLKFWSLIIDSVRCGGAAFEKPRRKGKTEHAGSARLSEILKQPECWESEEVRQKEEALERLKSVARKLQDGSIEVVLEGAAEVRSLTKNDPHARTNLALLGVIPPLVALLDAEDPTFGSQIAALYALLNLAITNDANKAAIVKAGVIHKMLKLVETPNRAAAAAVVANFLGLSALDSNKPIIGSSGAIPFLVGILKDLDKAASSQAREDSLRALYNLSISPSNVIPILETDLIPYLITKIGDMDVTERILSILSNVVSVVEGRKRISNVPDVFPILIDALNWTDSPGCQEKASYILMVMAHKSYADRQAMIEAGIASSLLELTLLGSTLAQKRASRMLEFLRMDKGKQVSGDHGECGRALTATVSAPLCERLSKTLAMSSTSREEESSIHEDNEMMSQEKKAVKQLVQQSLQNNMNRMVKRANLPRDFVPSDRFMSLTSSPTCKSLPF